MLPPIAIIWCDISFDSESSYESMKNDFSMTTGTALPKKEPDFISRIILDQDKEQFRLNAAPLVVVQTIDEALKRIEDNSNKQTFLITSGSVGRFLLPKVINKHPHVHHFYIFTHNILLHMDWAADYRSYLKMFDHPTDLLVRLTRDISSYFIQQGEYFMQVNAPEDALLCFSHARNLETYANERDNMGSYGSLTTQHNTRREFLVNLNRLEGDNGLISRAEAMIRQLGYS